MKDFAWQKQFYYILNKQKHKKKLVPSSLNKLQEFYFHILSPPHHDGYTYTDMTYVFSQYYSNICHIQPDRHESP